VEAIFRTFDTFPWILELEFEWHKVRLVMAEMIHFIRQLEAYCRLEVIECSWKVLIDFLNKKEGDLDALIDCHRTYLDRIAKKILLWSSKPGKEVRSPYFENSSVSNLFPGSATATTPRYIHFHPTIPRSYGSFVEISQSFFRILRYIG